jgi:hypothetical protein
MAGRSFIGHCHCRALEFSFAPSMVPASWSVRECQCNFCRAHGARMTSDARGSVTFHVSDPSKLQRYRFGTNSADFWICRQCGVYVAAVLETPRGRFATLNVNTMEDAGGAAQSTAVSYEGETLEEKVARRERGWTPVSDMTSGSR